MKLFYSVNSPYARMVRIALLEKAIDGIEQIAVNSLDSPEELLAVNPLSKVPALQTDDGLFLCDSWIICDYIDQLTQPSLFPQDGSRFPVLARAMLAKGAMDAAVALVVQSRLPESQRSEVWRERHLAAIERTLSSLENDAASFAKPITIDALALGVLLSYLDFRHPGVLWRKASPGLAAWFTVFCERPSMQATQPQA